MPTQEGETEKLVRHLDSTFNNTLMLLTNRLTRLDMTVKKADSTKLTAEKTMEFGKRIVIQIGQVNHLITLVTRSIDKTTKVATTPLEPDEVADVMNSTKYILSVLLPRFATYF